MLRHGFMNKDKWELGKKILCTNFIFTNIFSLSSADAGSSSHAETTVDSIYSKSSPDIVSSSSTTSTYNSDDNDSICSDTNKADQLITEVTLLRLVNDRQKEQIQQISGEKNELLREVERLRQINNYVSIG